MKFPFYWLSVGIGLVILMVLLQSGALGAEAEMRLPLLTLLIVNEFGFFVTAIGMVFAGMAIKREGVALPKVLTGLANGVLAIAFVLLGMRLWPGLV